MSVEVRYRPRKCLPLYHYQIHPIFGFLHARIQTWFHFHVYVCLNGREFSGSLAQGCRCIEPKRYL
jgi:hypothetical protein